MARLGFKIAAFGLVLCAAQSAYAQDGSVSAGATASTPPPPPPSTPPATVSATTSASTSTSAPTPVVASATESADSNTPDHEGVIGHFAVGYMGISQLPIGGFGAAGGGGAAAAFAQNTITAPVIGVRYWLNRMIGIDGGIGFGLASGGTSTNNGNTEVDTDSPSSLGFALHGGVPLAFSHGKHYSFELIPEANVGLTSGTIKAAAANTPDTNLSGFRLDLGARVGTEIYFGFIGIPQLSLQASVGAYFTHQSWKVSQGNTSESVTATTLGTSVQGAPWAIFVNNISALYYF